MLPKARTGTALDLIETNQAWAAAKVIDLCYNMRAFIFANCHRPAGFPSVFAKRSAIVILTCLLLSN
jgi:hypothetical protein